jgi:hypothetical protein
MDRALLARFTAEPSMSVQRSPDWTDARRHWFGAAAVTSPTRHDSPDGVAPRRPWAL